MATSRDQVFIDTNVLIYSKLALSPFHSAAVSVLESLSKGGTRFWISRQILREYLAGMTRPGTLTTEVSISDLVGDILSFTKQFSIAEDGPEVTEHLTKLVSTIPVAGKQVHDANIVATMLASGIPRLLTHNVDDFRRFAHLVTVTPIVEEDSVVAPS